MRVRRIIMIKQMVKRSERESDDGLEGGTQRIQKQGKAFSARIGSHDRWRNALSMGETYSP